MPESYNREAFGAAFNVSRETLDKLSLYYDILQHWQKRLNLVSARSLDDFWHRHVADSAQILAHIDKKPYVWLDIGSGAGFPALIVALLRPAITMHLVESNHRKAAFLDAIIREIDCPATTHACRAQDLSLPAIDMISARACAPLSRLLPLLAPHFNKISTEALLHKGKNWQDELVQAQKTWQVDYTAHASLFAEGACILHLQSRPKKR